MKLSVKQGKANKIHIYVDEEYRAEMSAHINNFWLIVKEHIEGWLSSDEIKI